MPSYTTSLPLLLLVLLPTSIQAHMQMTSPPPLHSEFNPHTPESLIDYSMTAPLIQSPTNFPCKGYVTSSSSGDDSSASGASGGGAMSSVADWRAGERVGVQFAEGGAPHLGGSCQFSMSYDLGKSWNVIQSTMGGCMIDTLTPSVTIPSEAPSGEALFAWSWFNHAGNREMYMNCAVVTISGGGSGLTGPPPFVANAGVNDCVTIEGTDVVFPDPGPVVEYGGSYTSSRPTTPTAFTGTNCVGPGTVAGSGSGSGSGSTSTGAGAGAGNVLSSAVASAATTATSASVPAVATPAVVVQSSAAAPSASPSSSSPLGNKFKTSCKRSSRSRKRSLKGSSHFGLDHSLDARQRHGQQIRRISGHPSSYEV